MYTIIVRIFFKLSGWKIIGKLPDGMKKCVLIAAPHTSNWDFIYGSFAWKLLGLNVKYLIKKEWFRFPFRPFFRALGGIPVDRNQSANLMNNVIKLVNSKEEFIILITPKGTRKKVERWKTGFYFLAMKAKIPVVLGKMNYATKTATIGPSFMPSGDIQKDFEIIREFYKDAVGKNPENFSVEGIQPSSFRK